jgi:hypothetical protein
VGLSPGFRVPVVCQWVLAGFHVEHPGSGCMPVGSWPELPPRSWFHVEQTGTVEQGRGTPAPIVVSDIGQGAFWAGFGGSGVPPCARGGGIYEHIQIYLRLFPRPSVGRFGNVPSGVWKDADAPGEPEKKPETPFRGRLWNNGTPPGGALGRAFFSGKKRVGGAHVGGRRRLGRTEKRRARVRTFFFGARAPIFFFFLKKKKYIRGG